MPSRLTHTEIFDRLRNGNARFVKGQMEHPRLCPGMRKELAEKGQEPFATILACSDSRGAVETIFDVGLGDVFVVRVAGNVCGASEVATVEFGVEYLHIPVCVVMGHTQCGAVTAVVKGLEFGGNIPKLIEPIQQAVDKAKEKVSESDEDAFIVCAVKENVYKTIDDLLSQSEVLRKRVDEGMLKIVGAIYNLSTGVVEFL